MQLRRLVISGALAVGLVVAAACGSGGNGDVSPAETATDPDPTVRDTKDEPVAAAAERIEIDLIECEQFALLAAVDRAAAQAVVPDEFTSLNVLAHVSKQCEDLRVDGISFGAGHFDAQWISVSRPADIDLSDTNLGADFNYPVLFQTDNMAWQEALASFGVPMEYAEAMTFETTADSMNGGANGSTAVPPANYEWSATGAVRETEPTGTIAHVLLRHDGRALRLRHLLPVVLDRRVGASQARAGAGLVRLQRVRPRDLRIELPSEVDLQHDDRTSRRRPVTVEMESVVS